MVQHVISLSRYATKVVAIFSIMALSYEKLTFLSFTRFSFYHVEIYLLPLNLSLFVPIRKSLTSL
jgi:hypothetical protein